MPYSQNNEEELILAELDRQGIKTGHFLDIGAWDGKGFSNTYRLAELDWSGICVEPSPYVFPKLVENHAEHPKITLVNAAISAMKSSLIPWFDSGGDAISTTSQAHREKWEKGWQVKYREFWIYMMPMDRLFDVFDYDFDFINIDVEGTNIELFRVLPWTALKKTKIICVEHDTYMQEMSAIAAKYGFTNLGLNGENLLLARQ